MRLTETGHPNCSPVLRTSGVSESLWLRVTVWGCVLWFFCFCFLDCINKQAQHKLALCCWFLFSISWGLSTFSVKHFWPRAQCVLIPEVTSASFALKTRTAGRSPWTQQDTRPALPLPQLRCIYLVELSTKRRCSLTGALLQCSLNSSTNCLQFKLLNDIIWAI